MRSRSSSTPAAHSGRARTRRRASASTSSSRSSLAASSTSGAARACSRLPRRSSASARLLAIDHDEAAVEAARRNVEANGVEVDVLLGDALGGRLPSADVGFANIDLSSVQAIGAAVDVRTLVTAGYFHTRMPEPARYAHRERRIDGGWAADRFVRAVDSRPEWPPSRSGSSAARCPTRTPRRPRAPDRGRPRGAR